jgi:hypothetical protein
MITFVKHEGTNLVAMTTTLHSIIGCEPLKILKVYEDTHFGHVMFKACQYVTYDDKVFVGLQHVSVKDAQVNLQKTITWGKKLRSRR